MKKVLVTGARGFIGRRCLPLLAEHGFEVHAVSSQQKNVPNWHRCDLLDAAAAEALVERVRPTHLLHLAWVAEPGVFWASPLNLAWLESGVRLARRFFDCGGERAVGAGSCAEYTASAAPCTESVTPLEPDTLYGEAKAAMYFALRAAARSKGSWAWARLFFPYGPGEAPGRFIPSLIDGLRRGERVDCTHGSQVRDFVYVDDVAAAFVALLNGEFSGAFNIGCGEGRTLREVAGEVVRETGRGELIRFGARQAPAYDPPYVVADISKMRALGWRPRIGLCEGVRLTMASS
jgi:nucleoside-diphosphate-sugar epimerase